MERTKKHILTKCPYSATGMICLVHHCPLSNKAFSNDLDKWALLGRTVKGSHLNPFPGNRFEVEYAMLKKCRMALLFEDDGLILDFIAEGKMSLAVCKELVRGEKKYRRLRWREKYNQ